MENETVSECLQRLLHFGGPKHVPEILHAIKTQPVGIYGVTVSNVEYK